MPGRVEEQFRQLMQNWQLRMVLTFTTTRDPCER